MQGWECPKCGQVYAPHVEKCITCLPVGMCSFCGGALWVCRGVHNICTTPGGLNTSVSISLTEQAKQIFV